MSGVTQRHVAHTQYGDRLFITLDRVPAVNMILQPGEPPVLGKIVFVNCAFLGVLPNSLIWTMFVTQSVIAIVYEAICYFGATKWIIKWGRTLQPGTI